MFQILRDYNKQAPSKAKKIFSIVIAVIFIGLFTFVLWRYVVTPIRRSALLKKIAEIQADIDALNR